MIDSASHDGAGGLNECKDSTVPSSCMCCIYDKTNTDLFYQLFSSVCFQRQRLCLKCEDFKRYISSRCTTNAELCACVNGWSMPIVCFIDTKQEVTGHVSRWNRDQDTAGQLRPVCRRQLDWLSLHNADCNPTPHILPHQSKCYVSRVGTCSCLWTDTVELGWMMSWLFGAVETESNKIIAPLPGFFTHLSFRCSIRWHFTHCTYNTVYI